jgi:hypothetical protein
MRVSELNDTASKMSILRGLNSLGLSSSQQKAAPESWHLSHVLHMLFCLQVVVVPLPAVRSVLSWLLSAG